MLKRTSLVTLGTTAILVVVLVVAGRTGLLTSFNQLLSRIFSPLARVNYIVGSILHPDHYDGRSAAQLYDELEKTKAENRELLAERGRLAEVEQENINLKKMLDYQKSVNYDLITARVIARSPADPLSREQAMTLDQGSEQGIRVGQAVLDTEGILVGKITDTTGTLSQGCLLFKDNCRVAVAIQGQSGTIGIVQSDLNLALKIDFIPHGRLIEVGQIIVTSGLEEEVPAGLVIGRVSQVITEGNELWQHALVEPIGNFDTLKIVGILKR